MAQMTTEEMIDYLKLVYAQESFWHEQLEKYDTIRQLEITKKTAAAPQQPTYDKKMGAGISILAPFFSIPFYVIVVVLFVIANLFGAPMSVITFAISFAVPYAVFLFISFSIDKNADESNSRKRQNYDDQYRAYEKQQADYDKSFELKISQKNALLAELKRNADESRKVLDILYEDNTIYKDFRNIIAVSALLSYFESGRYTELGAAYNQFALEYRLDNIGIKLDDIDHKLSIVIQKIDNLNSTFRECWEESARRTEAFQSQMLKSINQISNSQESIINNQLVQNERLNTLAKNTDVLKYVTNYQHRNIDISRLAMKYSL